MVAASREVQEVLEQVGKWAPDDRRRLAEEILKSLRTSPPSAAARPKKSLKDLVGLLRTDGPPPDDVECERILEEELIKKHLR